MKKKFNFKKLLKNKTFILFAILFIAFLVIVILLWKVFFPFGGSNYGNRLDGIEKISFTEKTQKSITKSIKDNEKVESSKLLIHGKIINVIFDVKEDTTIDDAKAIATASLEKFSKEVKGFYDIEFMITKTKEKGEEVEITKDDGTKGKEIRKQFPIMGYKKASRDSIVW